MLQQHLMSRAFSRLLRFRALVTIVAHLLAVVACNVCKIFGAFWHSLASRARRGSVRTANRCSLTLSVGRLSTILRCMTLFHLFDPVVVSLSTSLDLVAWDIIGSIALPAFSLLGLKGF